MPVWLSASGPWLAPNGKYHDLNVSHPHELLAREEQIEIGRSTLDR